VFSFELIKHSVLLLLSFFALLINQTIKTLKYVVILLVNVHKTYGILFLSFVEVIIINACGMNAAESTDQPVRHVLCGCGRTLTVMDSYVCLICRQDQEYEASIESDRQRERQQVVADKEEAIHVCYKMPM
jgi:hypothetical protein